MRGEQGLNAPNVEQTTEKGQQLMARIKSVCVFMMGRGQQQIRRQQQRITG